MSGDGPLSVIRYDDAPSDPAPHALYWRYGQDCARFLMDLTVDAADAITDQLDRARRCAEAEAGNARLRAEVERLTAELAQLPDVKALRAELFAQWIANHFEHCGSLPCDAPMGCSWPLPDVVGPLSDAEQRMVDGGEPPSPEPAEPVPTDPPRWTAEAVEVDDDDGGRWEVHLILDGEHEYFLDGWMTTEAEAESLAAQINGAVPVDPDTVTITVSSPTASQLALGLCTETARAAARAALDGAR